MSARTNSRICPLCTIEIKESRLVPQHVYIEHAHSGTKPLSVEEIKVLSGSSHKSFLCNCSLLPPLDDIPGFHRVAWEDIVKHTEQRHLAGNQPQFLASAKHQIANMQLALVSVHVRLCLLVLTLLQPDSLPAMRK